MRYFILLSLTLLILSPFAKGQTEAPRNYNNFPLIVTLQFHSLALPFSNIKSNFSNVGFGVGTEISYNGKQSFVQQVHAVWYRNKAVGNGLLLFAQPTWRPALYKDFFGEIKGGVGYLYSFRPVESYKQEDGNWVSVGHKGKGMLAVPLGISFGYNSTVQAIGISPFLSYQFVVMSGYNKSVPVIPQTFFQVGSRIHFN
jgi:hypothetical protein